MNKENQEHIKYSLSDADYDNLFCCAGSANGSEEKSMIRKNINRHRSASHSKGHKRREQKGREVKLSGVKQQRAIIGTLRLQGITIGRGGRPESKASGVRFHRSVPYSDYQEYQ